ncbi:hypothetical protein C0J52_17421 [Blattella germanica]|nr:hypothetical protein C0J52_17421 [Blattella germanica]
MKMIWNLVQRCSSLQNFLSLVHRILRNSSTASRRHVTSRNIFHIICEKPNTDLNEWLTNPEDVYRGIHPREAPYIKEVPVEVLSYQRFQTFATQQRTKELLGVMTSFEFVSDIPNKTVLWSKQGYEYVSKQLDADQQM